MPWPFSPGEILTAANLNAVTVGPASTVWSSPINAGITIGNGSVTAFYYPANAHLFAFFKFTFGSTSAVTGDVSLVLPVASSISHAATGSGWYFDASAPSSSSPAFILSTSTSTVILRGSVASTTHTTNVVLSATVPFTWATGDMIIANVHYLVA